MRFSITAVLALAAGAIATEAVTETVTKYTTYCPEATSIVHSGTTYSISTPGHLTMSGGHYTVTRPLITSTVTECKKCSSTPLPSSSAVSVSPSSSAVLTSTPYVPSGAAATGVPGTSAGTGAGSVGSSASGASAASTSQPAYNAGSANVAGAGVGLAAVFGAVALLL
ncbi:hypothetical protein N7454_003609 [Penicillium verhagenii]|nr:hypothetical protein N7454_003609 [Penicillium verhagenii]